MRIKTVRGREKHQSVIRKEENQIKSQDTENEKEGLANENSIVDYWIPVALLENIQKCLVIGSSAVTRPHAFTNSEVRDDWTQRRPWMNLIFLVHCYGQEFWSFWFQVLKSVGQDVSAPAESPYGFPIASGWSPAYLGWSFDV